MKVLLKDIKIGERFRKEFVDIDKLAASIQEHGLIEPVIVDENFNLIAGERRVRAHQLLKKEEIEVKLMSDLDDVHKKEIELEENIQRNAFTWQEEVSAKNQLHTLKQQIHGVGISGVKIEGAWTMRDTATALGGSLGSTAMDIQLAKGMRAFPELMKEKTKSAAYKKMKQMQENILNTELAKRLQKSEDISHPSIIHGDCFVELQKMETGSVDLILTDPPYGIDFSNAHTQKTADLKMDFEDGHDETFDLLDRVIKELFRVLKNDRHMYIFFGIEKYQLLRELLEKHGFVVHAMPLIWDKGSGSYASQSTTFVHSYEPFFHCWKGSRKINGTPKDVFQVSRASSKSKIHPTEKPTQLLRDLIGFSTLPGEVVLDPFAGSGSTIVAARECQRKGIGIELNLEYYQGICNRLNATEIK